jgi:CubicO group peptidase (beta-lactamase class C family)
MTSGLTYDFPWNDHPGLSTVAFANELGRRDLAFDPGDRWQYGYSADVMGAVIEVATGKRFGDFLREEIFGPLGMRDTSFFVPPERRGRLCTPYWLNPETGRFQEHVERIDHLGVSDWSAPPSFESGGAGLFSTAADMQAWTRMLLAGGVSPDGRRLLSPATFRAMTSGLLTERQARTFTWDNCEGQQYGYFNHVQGTRCPQGLLSGPGALGWGGWMGTQTWIDPAHGLGCVFLVQAICVKSQLANRVRNVVGAAAER